MKKKIALFLLTGMCLMNSVTRDELTTMAKGKRND